MRVIYFLLALLFLMSSLILTCDANARDRLSHENAESRFQRLERQRLDEQPIEDQQIVTQRKKVRLRTIQPTNPPSTEEVPKSFAPR